MDVLWNLWHGCLKKSEGCLHCYVFRRDAELGIDSTQIYKTKSFDLPIRRTRKGDYKVVSDSLVWTCFTSDFFLTEADEWRAEAWQMIKNRPDLRFFMVTKRPEHILQSLPVDWGLGYENVIVCCTIENQIRADERVPLFASLPLPHKMLICEPLLEAINLDKVFSASWCEKVIVGGESGNDARLCNFDWVLHLRDQCVTAGVPFQFKQTGAHFQKDGIVYRIPRHLQAHQAKRAHIDFFPENT